MRLLLAAALIADTLAAPLAAQTSSYAAVDPMIGTGGARDFYGTAAIPLGDHAGAVVSVESSRYGPRH